MKAIVGLGNPGDDYQGTRHNVGFEVVNELARRWNVKLRKWKSLADAVVVQDREVVLVEPKTYMNLSGEAVHAVMAFYKIPIEDVLVVVDEVQLPVGRIRLRPSGSAGGHNGLKSVIQHVGTGFPRLRLGVDRAKVDSVLRDHVLSKFSKADGDVVDAAVERAANAVETFVDEGLLSAMNKFNAPAEIHNLKSEI